MYRLLLIRMACDLAAQSAMLVLAARNLSYQADELNERAALLRANADALRLAAGDRERCAANEP